MEALLSLTALEFIRLACGLLISVFMVLFLVTDDFEGKRFGLPIVALFLVGGLLPGQVDVRFTFYWLMLLWIPVLAVIWYYCSSRHGWKRRITTSVVIGSGATLWSLFLAVVLWGD